MKSGRVRKLNRKIKIQTMITLASIDRYKLSKMAEEQKIEEKTYEKWKKECEEQEKPKELEIGSRWKSWIWGSSGNMVKRLMSMR